MSRVEKIITVFASLGGIGGVAGLWGAYTAYDASKFRQPIDLHIALVSSFQNQISSAEERSDNEEVVRVRKLYEAFEENWRETKKLASLVSHIESLATNDVSDDTKREIKVLLSSFSAKESLSSVEPITLGGAYFAIGDYERAAEQYSVVTAQCPADVNAFALKAASLSRLSRNVSDPEEKASLKTGAYQSWLDAIHNKNAGRNVELFLQREPALKDIVEEKSNNSIQTTPRPWSR